jgi:hypothetical protein
MQPDERNMTFLVIAGTVLVEAVVGFSAILAFPLWGKVAPELAPVTDEGYLWQCPILTTSSAPCGGTFPASGEGKSVITNTRHD